MFSCKFVVPYSLLEELDAFLDEKGLYNVSIFENPKLGFSDDVDNNGFPIAKFFDVEIYANSKTEAENLYEILTRKFKESIQDFQISNIDNKDWIELYKKELKPVILDNFYFYNGSIQENTTDSSLIPIKLNSALAFGSGHHQTTQACILNANFLKDIAFTASNILDMGCGTGILGIGALKIWKKANLLGIDIDPDAVEITLDNYKANDIKARAITGHDLSGIKENFDLIFCNILKQPLLDLANSFYERLIEGGYIITSGFIKSQEDEVINKYQSIGFQLINKITMEEWISVLFRKQ